jgi:monofunctional glycosyltransferase
MPFLPSHPRLRLLAKALLGFIALPYVLAVVYLLVPAPSTLMLVGWLSGQKVEREWVPLNQMSPHLINAVLTAEDSAFCEHFGFDIEQLGKSIEKAKKRGKPVRATSTISQQTAKNLFLWHGRSWLRKALETPLTLWIEAIWPKKRILEVYLNIAQWGNGIYGAQAAAQAYFGVSAAKLTGSEAALLATALPSPTRRAANRPNASHALRAQQVWFRVKNQAPDTSCLK